MRKWFLIMAAALVLCSACGKKDTSVNGVTQEAQASSTEAESLYKEGAGYVGEEDYESAIESLLKCIELGRENGVSFPEKEPAQKTNFIR